MNDDVQQVRRTAESMLIGGGDAPEWKRIQAVARAYLADHPADDVEPVTAEWLESLGFVDTDENTLLARNRWLSEPDLISGQVGQELRFVAVNGDKNGGVKDWSVEIRTAGKTWGKGQAVFYPNTTRGHVRRLCTALGIPLTQPESGVRR